MQNNFYFIRLLTTLFILIVVGQTFGAEKPPELSAAGKHVFTKKNTVKWRIDREEIDEKSGKSSLTKDIAATEGETAVFELAKIPSKETIYYITAEGRNFRETRKIQVFSAGIPSPYTFRSKGNPVVKAFLTVPQEINSATRLILVMSGIRRNADEYAGSWIEWGNLNNYIIVSPSFDDENWEGARGYNFGNVFSGSEGGGRINPRENWSFTVVDELQREIGEGFGLKINDYDIFGHSAGGQFVHRFLLFNPQARVRLAIAANAGWYTLPDPGLSFPYGLKHPLFKFTEKEILDWTNRRMIIMRGTADTSREGTFRATPEADAQGKNRFERAGFMFARGRAYNPQTRWSLIDVKGADHDQKKMAVAAQKFLTDFNLDPGGQASLLANAQNIHLR